MQAVPPSGIVSGLRVVWVCLWVASGHLRGCVECTACGGQVYSVLRPSLWLRNQPAGVQQDNQSKQGAFSWCLGPVCRQGVERSVCCGAAGWLLCRSLLQQHQHMPCVLSQPCSIFHMLAWRLTVLAWCRTVLLSVFHGCCLGQQQRQCTAFTP